MSFCSKTKSYIIYKLFNRQRHNTKTTSNSDNVIDIVYIPMYRLNDTRFYNKQVPSYVFDKQHNIWMIL